MLHVFCYCPDRRALDIKLSKIDIHLEIHCLDAIEVNKIPKLWYEYLLWDSIYFAQFLFHSNARMQQVSSMLGAKAIFRGYREWKFSSKI